MRDDRDNRQRVVTDIWRIDGRSIWTSRLPLWLCVVQAILAYEWLVSGVDKLLDHGFGGQLTAILSQGVQGNAGSVYGAVLAHLVLPNHTVLARLIPWTETGIGALMLLGAILWMAYPRAQITGLVAGAACLALLTAAMLDLTYYALGGGGVPWINPVNATQEGIDVDVMLLLFALTLCASNAQAVLQRHHTRRGGAGGDSVATRRQVRA